MFCTNCGTSLNEGSKFCTKCGQPLEINDGEPEKESQYINRDIDTQPGFQDNIQPESEEKIQPEILSTKDNIHKKTEDEASNHQKITESRIITKNNEKSFKIDDYLKGFSWLVFAVFILQGGFLPKSIILMAANKPVSTWWFPLWSVVSYIAVLFLIRGYIKSQGIVDQAGDKFLPALIGGITPLLIIFGSFSAFGLIVGNLYGLVINFGMDSPAKGIILLAVFIVMLFLLQLFLISGLLLLYVTVRYRYSFFQSGKAYKTVIAWMISVFPKMAVINIVVSILLIAVYFIQDIAGGLINVLQPYGFMRTFLNYLLAAVLTAVVFSVIFRQGSRLSADKNESLLQLLTDTSKGLPVLAIVFAIPVAVLLILVPMQSGDAFKRLTDEYKGYVNRGDILRDMGRMTAAGLEYDKALSGIKGLEGYLKMRKSILNSDGNLVNEGEGLLNQAASINPWNEYVPLFRGRYYTDTANFGGAVTQYELAVKNPLVKPEVFLGLYQAYRAAGRLEDSKKIMDWLMGNQVYSDTLNSLEAASIKKLDDWLDALANMVIEYEPRLAWKYYEKAFYNKHQQALDGLLPLRDKYPENAEIQYMLTRIYAEYRNEQSNYPALIGAADNFSKLTEETSDPELLLQKDSFAASAYLMANDIAKAESVYNDLYKRYPQDRETAENYAYVLIKAAKFDNALDVLNKMTDKDNTLRQTYLHAICLLNLNKHSESLDKMAMADAFKEPYTEEYDRYLYAYALAFANSIKSQEHIDLLTAMPDTSIIKNYNLAMKAWKDKDNTSAIPFMEQVLGLDERMGYAWYCQAVNYYENAVRNATGDFSMAIECYIKSLKIIPDHVEGYFALAHCYKKADMKPEALRAFRKVLELLPYEDHRVDPYGMTVHAIGEVNTLSAEIEGGN